MPGVDLRFRTELLAVRAGRQRRDRPASATSRPSKTRKIACTYLVGADGARSMVREAIGAKMNGRYGLSRNYNVVFRSRGLAAAHAHGPAVMYWQVNRDLPSVIGPMDKDDRWFFAPTAVADGMTRADFESTCADRQSDGHRYRLRDPEL